MSRRHLVSLTFAGIAALIAVPASVRSVAQRQAPNANSQPVRGQPQRTIELAVAAAQQVPMVRPDAEGADYGPTFHVFESRATNVTTRFGNVTAVAERGIDGIMRTSLKDNIGNELAKLRTQRHDAQRTALEFSTAGTTIGLGAPLDTVPTLNWANLQAYALWNDKVQDGGDVHWRNRLARTMTGNEVASEVREVRTEFQGEIIATTSSAFKLSPGYRGPRPTFVTTVTVHGVEVGKTAWYAREQVFSWHFPGLTNGAVDPERLKPIGGWNFRPTMGWANVQGLAFYDLHTRMKLQGKVARENGWLQRLAARLVPTLHAQDGCTGFHWLDNTVYRPCCDVHDQCYYKYGCDRHSWWWPFGYAWQCTGCNGWAAWCFASGGFAPYHQSP